DQNAKQAITSTRTEIDPRQIDTIPPSNEFLVLDADSSQQATIAAALSLQSGVIVGPPGTGKSQTIANLIAEFTAHGKRVLFVAEKRAALDVVQSRLAGVGLGHLTLDLHGVGLKRRQILKQFAETLDEIRKTPPVDADELHRKCEERRKQLRDHVSQMHDSRPPSGLSAYRLQGLVLSATPDETSKTHWRAVELDRLRPDVIAEASNLIQEAGGFASLLSNSDPSPWRDANLLDGATVASATDTVRQMAITDWPELKATLSEFLAEVSALPVLNLSRMQSLLDLQAEINASLGQFTPEIFAPDFADLQHNFVSMRTNPIARALKWCLSADYRNSCRRIRALAVGPVPRFSSLRENLIAAVAEGAEWHKFASSDISPSPSRSLDRCRKALDKITHSLRWLGPILRRSDLMDLPIADLEALIKTLAADNVTPYRLPRYYEIGRRLTDLGVANILRELRGSSRTPEKWPAMLRNAWYSSCLDAIRAEAPQVGGFNGRVHDEVIEEFKRLDEDRLKYSVDRVLRAHAERAVATMNEHQDQEELVRREANKQRGGLSFRDLASRASDVLLALRPCWLASPLSVSEMLPRVSGMFDVVLFDEASQILPTDALPALARANHAIIGGDPNQLPPSTFFAAGADSAEIPSDDIESAGFQSLLTQMLGLMSPWSLNWHYRSRDESLIAFSNHYIYGDRLVTFPGIAGQGSAISHVLVPASARRDGQEESSSDEVRKVVELILDHASKRPDESLGVIALGITHANNVQAALDQALRDRSDLDDFFDERKRDRFFVKNLERVQGDERDAIILTVGYGKDRTGRLLYHFGPLLQEGGERRLNVAITRAKNRMTVVSAFDHRDMDPARSTKRGVDLLRLYLEYAASGGKTLGDRGLTNIPLDLFEADV
ncbi:MAG: DEAD/DEAH box helicase, partial [Acidobacteriaceae bacterium]